MADLVAIAYYEDWHPLAQPGKVLVLATPGGSRDRDAPRRRFLVDVAEYRAGARPFIIQPEKHTEVAGA